MSWTTDGHRYTTGAAASRCYDDLVRQRGKAAADRLRDDSVKKMERVRVLFPVGRGQQKFDVTVEALLLAAGVPENEVERLAGRYRKGSGASVDLTPYA
jgi:hypothetical protein